jgi:uncharacterized GH25 family protein
MRWIARILFPALAVIALAGRLSAHEFWIEPQEFQVETGAAVVADLRNGQNFRGSPLAWFERRMVRAEWILGAAGGPLENRTGERPAISVVPAGEGLLRLVYQSSISELTYTEWQKFEQFVTSKGFPEAVARHRARGLPEVGIKEIYARFCKALVAVGDGAGADAALGMEAELVALANPYADDLSGGMAVQVLYQGAPRAGATLDVFERGPGGGVEHRQVTADAGGVAVVAVRPGHAYLLDSVMLREATGAAMWESLWASLTFAVPG